MVMVASGSGTKVRGEDGRWSRNGSDHCGPEGGAISKVVLGT